MGQQVRESQAGTGAHGVVKGSSPFWLLLGSYARRWSVGVSGGYCTPVSSQPHRFVSPSGIIMAVLVSSAMKQAPRCAGAQGVCCRQRRLSPTALVLRDPQKGQSTDSHSRGMVLV
jgi:hypothetical protein